MQGVSQYPLMIKELDNSYHVICRPLGLITDNTNLMTAYTDMKQLQIKTLERFKQLSISPPLPFEGKTAINNHKGSILTFFIKSTIIIFLIAIPFMWVTRPIVKSLNHIATVSSPLVKTLNEKISHTQSDSFKPRILVNRFAKKLEEASPEQKEEIRESLHIIVKEILPYVIELRPLFSEQQNQEKAGTNNT